MLNTKNLIRALRLPFITASVLPFIFGSLLAKDNFYYLNFIIGLIAVVSTHLSANLINDYADSKSGVDWKDKNYYNFFGGSKLIQQGVFPERFYLRLGLLFTIAAGACILILSLLLRSPLIIVLYITILLLSWFYSISPLKFSYRRLGEIIIFLLFGPALVMGGYFIQTKIFPSQEAFLLSLPFGFLTTAILFVNEIPDFSDDRQSGKFTWVNFLGQQRSFLLYFLLIFFAFFFIILNIAFGYLHFLSSLSLIFIILPLRAAKVLKDNYTQKTKLIDSSRLTIALQALVSAVLILSILK